MITKNEQIFSENTYSNLEGFDVNHNFLDKVGI